MLNNMFRNQKVLYFISGAISATLGVKFLKSKTARNICVQGLSKGMKIQQDVLEAFQNMKEEATDICYDAKEQAGEQE